MATRTLFHPIITEGITAVAGVRGRDSDVFMRITTCRAQYVVTVSGRKLHVRFERSTLSQ